MEIEFACAPMAQLLFNIFSRSGSLLRLTGHNSRHQQQLAVLIVAVGLGKIPEGSLRLIVTSPSRIPPRV